MKKHTPINLPNGEDQFSDVPFVNNMTQYQLKVMIKRLWCNVQSLANEMDNRRKDVSQILDIILDGGKWSKKDIKDRWVYHFYKGYIIRCDTLKNQLVVMNKKFELLEKPIQGVTLPEIKEMKKKKVYI